MSVITGDARSAELQLEGWKPEGVLYVKRVTSRTFEILCISESSLAHAMNRVRTWIESQLAPELALELDSN